MSQITHQMLNYESHRKSQLHQYSKFQSSSCALKDRLSSSNLNDLSGHQNSHSYLGEGNNISVQRANLCKIRSMEYLKPKTDKLQEKTKPQSDILKQLEVKISGLHTMVRNEQGSKNKNLKEVKSSEKLPSLTLFPKNYDKYSQNAAQKSKKSVIGSFHNSIDSASKKIIMKQDLRAMTNKNKFSKLQFQLQGREGQEETENKNILCPTKNRQSAPIKLKSNSGEFWNGVFKEIKQRQGDLNKLEKKSSEIEQTQISNNFQKNCQVNNATLPTATNRKCMTSKSENQETFYKPEKYPRVTQHKNSDTSPIRTDKNSKETCNIKKTCELSSKILRNSKLLLSNLKSSPYFTTSASNKVLTQSNVDDYKQISTTFNNQYLKTNENSSKPETDRTKIQKNQKIDETIVKKDSHKIYQNITNQQNEKTISGNKFDQSSSTNFSHLDAEIPNFLISQVSQGSSGNFPDIGASKIDETIKYQGRKRIVSPILARPMNKVSLADFHFLATTNIYSVAYSDTDSEDMRNSLSKRLGRGKFGQVFLAQHIDTGFLYALKKISKKTINQYKMEEQAIDEIRIHSLLSHPNIIKLYGFFEDKGNVYLILEYIQGGTLFDYLNVVEKIPLSIVLKFLKDIIQSVTYMHERSIAHRDIKPENILLVKDGTTSQILSNSKGNKNNNNIQNATAKLCDFGWSAHIQTSRKTYCGTFDYVPPEILQRKNYDISVDIWSIGILAYELLTGKMPYQGDRDTIIYNKINEVDIQYPQISKEFPKEARQFIQALVRKNPDQRPKCKNLLSMPLFNKYCDKNNEAQTFFTQKKNSEEKRTKLGRLESNTSYK